MKLLDFLTKECVIPSLESGNKTEALRELSLHLTSIYSNISSEKVFEVLVNREKLCSTAVDEGVAIPHGKLSGLSSIIAVFGKSKQGIDFESLDGNPTHLFILLLTPENSSIKHLKLLARISRIFKSSGFRSELMQAKSRDEIYQLISDEDDKH